MTFQDRDRRNVSISAPVAAHPLHSPVVPGFGVNDSFSYGAYDARTTFSTPSPPHPMRLSSTDDVRVKSSATEKGTLSMLISDAGDGAYQPPQLHRQLRNRHVQMISIGGVIGTGLFIGTAKALDHGGPAGLLLGYGIMGTVVYCVMVSLGEMVSHLPLSGGHITLARRFTSDSTSFTMGWCYWYSWTICLPAELNASAVIVSYWQSSVHPAVWITVILTVAFVINLGGSRAYGEAEFWFASIKVITIIGLIILGLIIDGGGIPGRPAIGFKFWQDPGPFVQYAGIPGALGRFLGFFAVLAQAAFSYSGTEITAMAAGETKDPRRTLPRAIRAVWIRICLFYVLSVFVIGLIVPSNDPRLDIEKEDAGASPFVFAISDAGIKALPSIINAALLTSAWSAAASSLYTASRALYGLSIPGSAPRVFSRVNRYGLPYVAVVTSGSFGLLSYMSVRAGTAGEVFNWFSDMTSVASLLTWIVICYTYLRFFQGIKAQQINRSDLPFKAIGQPFLAIYALVMCMIVLVFNGFWVFLRGNGGFRIAGFVCSYLPIVLFVVMWVGHKLATGTRRIPLLQMDFFSGSRDPDTDGESVYAEKENRICRLLF